MKFVVYADGSSGGNSMGAIGWGWVIVCEVGDHKNILAAGNGGYREGTNNVAELMAAREGLRALFQHPAYKDQVASGKLYHIVLVSDSQYALGLANGSYSATKNTELAAHLHDICRRHFVQTKWVKGHNGDPANEMCDRLAKLGRERYSEKKANRRRRRRSRRKGMLQKAKRTLAEAEGMPEWESRKSSSHT